MNRSSGLAHKRYLTVVLRLLLDEAGELVHGEIVYLKQEEAGGRPRPPVRFARWENLSRAIRQALARVEANSRGDAD